jgi:hypothetical protein
LTLATTVVGAIFCALACSGAPKVQISAASGSKVASRFNVTPF